MTIQALASDIPTQLTHIDLSVVMPAYNEAENVGLAVQRTLGALRATSDTYEVIVVDDGSTDGTAAVVEGISSLDSHVRLIKNSRNMGKGVAVKRSAEFTRGESVVVIDADMEVVPEQLQRYVHILNDHDICIASKRHPDSVYKAPLMRKFLSVTFNMVARLLTGVKFADSQTGLKAMRGDHFKRIMGVITVKRYAYDVEVLAVAQLMKSRVAELPVRIEQNSAFRAKAAMYMLVDLLGIVYRLRIIKWYQKNLRKSQSEYKPILRL